MRQEILAWLANNVPTTRMNHILRVEQMAVDLAISHQLDSEVAARSALMHDLAKCFHPRKLLQMARADGLEVDDVMEMHPHLLHADVGAIVARDTFGIVDKEILQGIANHTLGRPRMSNLSCIVFLADSLEPGRGDSDELQVLRNTSFFSLERAMWLTCDRKLKSMLESRCVIHPRAVATRNWFLTKWKSKH